jgi:hypothetical protein
MVQSQLYTSRNRLTSRLSARIAGSVTTNSYIEAMPTVFVKSQLSRPDLESIEQRFRCAWDALTSSDPGWSPSLPSLGQCAVTALIVQDLYGGQLLRARLGEVTHYWNALPDGTEVDLTRDQFDDFVPADTTTASREYVLSFPVTRRRYELLKARLKRS